MDLKRTKKSTKKWTKNGPYAAQHRQHLVLKTNLCLQFGGHSEICTLRSEAHLQLRFCHQAHSMGQGRQSLSCQHGFYKAQRLLRDARRLKTRVHKTGIEPIIPQMKNERNLTFSWQNVKLCYYFICHYKKIAFDVKHKRVAFLFEKIVSEEP